jgi:hypothetical protein
MGHTINLDDVSQDRNKKSLPPEAIKGIESLLCPNCHTFPKYLGGQKFEYCCQYQFGEIVSVYNKSWSNF